VSTSPFTFLGETLRQGDVLGVKIPIEDFKCVSIALKKGQKYWHELRVKRQRVSCIAADCRGLVCRGFVTFQFDEEKETFRVYHTEEHTCSPPTPARPSVSAVPSSGNACHARFFAAYEQKRNFESPFPYFKWDLSSPSIVEVPSSAGSILTNSSDIEGVVEELNKGLTAAGHRHVIYLDGKVPTASRGNRIRVLCNNNKLLKRVHASDSAPSASDVELKAQQEGRDGDGKKVLFSQRTTERECDARIEFAFVTLSEYPLTKHREELQSLSRDTRRWVVMHAISQHTLCHPPSSLQPKFVSQSELEGVVCETTPSHSRITVITADLWLNGRSG
jgi:hypothetical protein